MPDKFSPTPHTTSGEPTPDNFLPRPTLISKGPAPKGAGAHSSGEDTDFDPTEMESGNRSGPGKSAGKGSNKEVRPEKVDKNFSVLP